MKGRTEEQSFPVFCKRRGIINNKHITIVFIRKHFWSSTLLYHQTALLRQDLLFGGESKFYCATKCMKQLKTNNATRKQPIEILNNNIHLY